MARDAAARSADAQRVATVLIAIDGHDAAAVRRLLGKSTPEPLPELSAESIAELRARFVQQASVPAVPAGGNNAILEPARRHRRSSLARAGLSAAVGAIAVIGLGYAAVAYLPDAVAGGAHASATASPSPERIAVRWAPVPAFDAALENFAFPECGDEFAPEPQSVDGVSAAPQVSRETNAEGGASATVFDNFVADDGRARTLLAQPGSIVLTLDGVVVQTVSRDQTTYEYFETGGAHTSQPGYVDPFFWCQPQAELNALFEKYGGGSVEDSDKLDAAIEKLYEKWRDAPPGDYALYVVTPVVFGEQAALAQVFASEGASSVAMLDTDLAYTHLSDDPRVAPYCTGTLAAGDRACTVPDDVREEVLTRELDPSSIDATPSGIVISEPLVYTVE